MLLTGKTAFRIKSKAVNRLLKNKTEKQNKTEQKRSNNTEVFGDLDRYSCCVKE